MSSSSSHLPESEPVQSSSSTHSSKIISQTSLDAKLHDDFNLSAGSSSFNYSASVRSASESSRKLVTAYLHQIQKSNFIQPFGCLLALDDKTFRVLAFSDNASVMLQSPFPISLSSDIRNLFTPTSGAALRKALGISEISLLNPILVHCAASGTPFYAIIHRVTDTLVIDFEPVRTRDVPTMAAGALQSYKLAAKAITRLQALPSGSMERLCDTMAHEVFELTGYDRVMIYKFHEDNHGEVLTEITKPGLEPYVGLHYPATDVPLAARFLFMKNKVRMICDCRANHVRVVRHEHSLSSNLSLCGSTLRAPHSCHLQYMENMKSMASLVMAIVLNDETGTGEPLQKPDKSKKLWGLVVCHHTNPRFIAFPVRYACKFLAQVFATLVNKEIELENQMVEKNVLRTHTILCDMLLRDAPLGIMSQSPNVMDLVRCVGAVLLYKNQNHRLGLTPNDFQIRDIVTWLNEYHRDTECMSTDSLYDAGFPGALALGDAVCGIVAIRISDGDWLFWFQSHTAAEIRWGGAKHETGDRDDSRNMHPRSSFKAFLEVVKTRCLPWKDYEMDAIRSLHLILRNASSKKRDAGKDLEVVETRAKLSNVKIDGGLELEAVTSEMVRLIETALVPIFAVGRDGLVNGWNTKIADLTGLPANKAMGVQFLVLVEDSSVDAVSKMLESALKGKEEQNVHFEIKTHGLSSESSPISLAVNACTSRDIWGNVIGVCFVAQDITTQKRVMDKFTRIEGDYQAIVQNPNLLIPPIFGANEFGWCSEWNTAMIKLSGWQREDVIGKMLLGEVFGTSKACCRLKNQEACVNLGVVMNNTETGQESGKIPFGFFTRVGTYVDCLLCASKKLNREGAVTGLFYFLQLASPELQQALHVQKISEQTALKRLSVLAYVRREIKSPLSGIIFSRTMMEGTELDALQKKLVKTSLHCELQLNKILDDTDLDCILEGYLDLEKVEFKLQDALIASISQVMVKSKAKGIMIVDNVAPNISSKTLVGDSLRLQQVLAAFLLILVNVTPNGGRLGVAATLWKHPVGDTVQLIRLEFRITHSGGGVPQELLNQMFGDELDASEDGITLFINRKLVKRMNGDVQYLREAGKSTFIISVELAIPT